MKADSPRKLGRPRGSSRLNEGDAALCQQIAERILADESLSTRQAILQVVSIQASPAARASTLRRLQGKFNREVHVDAARERVAEATRARQCAMQANLEGFRSIMEFMNGGPNFQRFVTTPQVKEVLESIAPFMNGGSFWKDLGTSPYGQTIKALQTSGVFGMQRPTKEVLEMIVGPRLTIMPSRQRD